MTRRDAIKLTAAMSGALAIGMSPAQKIATFDKDGNMILHLDGWKTIQVQLHGETITVSRDDMWKALKD